MDRRRFSRSLQNRSLERRSQHANVRFGRLAADVAPYYLTEAYYHPRETKDPKVDSCSTSSDGSATEEDSSSYELHGSLCKEINGTPKNKRIDDVRVVEKRRSSPSVIARLMGLDELHPQVVSEFKSETAHSLLKKSSSGLEAKFECSGHHSFHVNRRKQHNFRTVHDPCDSCNAKKLTDQVVQKEKGYSKPDVDFIKQQFLESKRLSTNEALQKTKEFNDALDILDSNKEIFLKFLQEPNPLFAKHFQGVKQSNSSYRTRHFTNFETSACNKRSKCEAYYQTVEENNGYAQKMKDTVHGCTNPSTSIGNCSTCDSPDALLLKSLRSQSAGKMKTSSHPTSIVVLKATVEKVQSTGRTVLCSRSLPNYEHSWRRQRKFHREQLFEREEQHRLFQVKTKECKTKDACKINRDIIEKTTQPLSRHSEKVLASRNDIQNSSSSYLSEPSLSCKATNGLLEPWKMTELSMQGLTGEGSTTLCEMLSLSDKVLQTQGDLSFKSLSGKKVEKEDLHDSNDYTSGISNSDGWKDECESFLPKYEDHPDLPVLYESCKPENKHEVDCIQSIVNCKILKDKLNLEQNDLNNSITDKKHSMVRNFKYRDNNPRVYRSHGEENLKPTKEVIVCQDASKNMINLNNIIEPKPVYLQRNMNELLHLVQNCSNSKDFHSEKSLFSYLKEFQQPAKRTDLSVAVLENEIPKVASVDFPLVECHMDAITESGALVVPKVAERLSPVSVLDPPLKDGKSTPECLETINAGFLDLQRQLNLLKVETVDSGYEQSKLLICNDETGREMLMLLKHGGGRDLLYLLDILTVSGIYASAQNSFFDACYLSDSPVSPGVFEKLEKKHNMVTLWSRSERKLLFELINSVLAMVLAPCMDLHPWVNLKSNFFCGRDRLVNESWLGLIRRQKELSKGKPEDKVLDSRWLYLDDHVDMIGREIERMVKDDLLDELISELFE